MFCLLLASGVTCQENSMAKIPMWTDIGLGNLKDWEDLDYKLSFLMETYDIISLEKCLFVGANDQNTEAVFLNLTSRMHTLRPESQTRILYYWGFSAIKCYQSTLRLLDQPALWLRDSTGYPVLSGPHHLPSWDFRMEEARQMWIEGGLGPVEESQGQAAGVFLDGTDWKDLTDCHGYDCGEEQDACCQFTEAEVEEYNLGLGQAVVELGDRVHALASRNIVIGNGLFNYDFNAGNGNPSYDRFVDKLDGFCMEHLMAFEATMGPNAAGPSFVRLAALENLIQLREKLVEAGKYLLVRAYPGPLGQPLHFIGGLHSPHLPAHHPYPQPTTNLQVQQAMKDLLNFTLAVHLCAFADENVYLSYHMWYNIRQAVPCPLSPEDCQWPTDFPELVDLRPGTASPAQWDGRVCTRWFQGFGVSVDLEDENSGTWMPVPPLA